MSIEKTGLLVVNFGGPRSLEEVQPFLESLLTDEELVRTGLPRFIEKRLFMRVARKRAPFLAKEYAKIGGRSPIYEDTLWFSKSMGDLLKLPTLTFHRYLEERHNSLIQEVSTSSVDRIIVFPLFPQFCYATTGSVAKWFSTHLPDSLLDKMQWVRSYASHPAYVQAFACCIREFLHLNNLKEEEVFFLFSAHGIPVRFVKEGDPYESECLASFDAIRACFPKVESFLAYQSKFGKGAWLEPATLDLCTTPEALLPKDKHIVFIPLSFSSEHIETLFEIEEYVKMLHAKGFSASRCPALGRRADWVKAAAEIVQTASLVSNKAILRC